jgi:hypothetical protein
MDRFPDGGLGKVECCEAEVVEGAKEVGSEGTGDVQYSVYDTV